MGDNKKNIEEAIKKINQRIPINGDECKAFCHYFKYMKHLAYLRYGLGNSLISFERLILNIPADDPEFEYYIVSFISFLLNNRYLDPNKYFTGPYNIKVHVLYWLYRLVENSIYIEKQPIQKELYEIFISKGCNVNKNTYDNSATAAVETLISVFQALGVIADEKKLSLFKDEYQYENQNAVSHDTLNSGDFKNFLDLLFLVSSGCVNSLRGITNECFFLNSLSCLRFGIFFGIKSENYEIFEIIIQKGIVCNYLEITEIISRHNLASENKDKILKDIYSKMIKLAIKNGSEIDKKQLELLSLEADVETIEKIKEYYSKPEWEKLCSNTAGVPLENIEDKTVAIQNARIRKIAFDLNLDFSLSTERICEKIKKIREIDRLEYVRAAINRQEERVARSLVEVGDLNPQEKLERSRCDKQTMIVNNPYSFNDARMSFYKDENDGKLWCFTSDMFEQLVETRKNPYNNRPLPEMFIETVKSQINILKSLDLMNGRDVKTVGETLEEIFDTTKEISNEFSNDFYERFIIKYRIITGKSEKDFRAECLNSPMGEFLDKIMFYNSFYFSDCDNRISVVGNKFLNFFTDHIQTNIGFDNNNNNLYVVNNVVMPSLTNDLVFFRGIVGALGHSTVDFDIFDKTGISNEVGLRFLEYIQPKNSGELIFKVKSFIIKETIKKFDKSRTINGETFYLNNNELVLFSSIIYQL